MNKDKLESRSSKISAFRSQGGNDFSDRRTAAFTPKQTVAETIDVYPTALIAGLETYDVNMLNLTS